MKKTILMMACCLLAAFQGFSNTLMVINNTGCDFSYSFRGLEVPPTGSTYFASAQITIPPGNTYYASPADVPGMSSLASTATFGFVKGYCVTTPSCDASVGDASWGLPQTFNSATMGCYPGCNGSNAYTVSWVVNSSGNVVLLIF